MRTQFSSVTKTSSLQVQKSSPLCKASGRPYNHYLSNCSYLPQSDKMYFAKARQIMGTDNNQCSDEEEISFPQVASVSRVQIRQSPHIDAFLAHHSVRITIDSGATGDMIRSDVADNLQAVVTPSSQYAHQADGLSPLHVSGETRLAFNHERQELTFERLVVDNLDTPILAGIPMTLQLDPPDRKSELVTSVYSGMALKLGKDVPPFGSHKYSELQWHTPQLCGRENTLRSTFPTI